MFYDPGNTFEQVREPEAVGFDPSPAIELPNDVSGLRGETAERLNSVANKGRPGANVDAYGNITLDGVPVEGEIIGDGSVIVIEGDVYMHHVKVDGVVVCNGLVVDEDTHGVRRYLHMNSRAGSVRGSGRVSILSPEELGLARVNSLSDFSDGEKIYVRHTDKNYYLWEVTLDGEEIYLTQLAMSISGGPGKGYKNRGYKLKVDPGHPPMIYRLIEPDAKINSTRLTPEVIQVGMRVKTCDGYFVGRITGIDVESEQFTFEIDLVNGKPNEGNSREMTRPFKNLGEMIPA